MYNIIIVEDEPIVRESIASIIDWGSIGFRLVDTFENGKQALVALENMDVDLILTDVCMPYIDGLELARIVKQKNPSTKVIVLTGYDEFSYVQKAIKLKVDDYILKPITPKELNEILTKVRNELDKINDNDKLIEQLKKKLSTTEQMLRDKFLNNVIEKGASAEYVKENMSKYHISFSNPFFNVAIINPDDYRVSGQWKDEQNDVSLCYGIYNIISEICDDLDNCVVFQNTKGSTILIICDKTKQLINKKLELLAEQIKKAVNSAMKINITIGMGRSSSSIMNIHNSFKEALVALKYRYVIGENNIIHYEDIETEEKSKHSLNAEHYENKVATAIKTGSFSETATYIHAFFNDLRSKKYSSDIYKFYIQRMIYIIKKAAFQVNSNIKEEIISKLDSITNRDIVYIDTDENMLLSAIKELLDCIIYKKGSFITRQAEKAVEYINENYSNSNLSLNMICNYLNLSTSYFSMIFKNYTGGTFVEYLTKVRIEKAKELLVANTKKTYEVAYEVGYSDPHYFSIIFKKNTGISPSKYKNKI